MLNSYSTSEKTSNPYIEKRKYPRYSQSIPLTYIPIHNSGDYPKQGQMINYSEGGLLFKTKNKIDPGTQMSIHITILNKHFIIKGNALRSKQLNPYEHCQNAIMCEEKSDYYVMRTINQIFQRESAN